MLVFMRALLCLAVVLLSLCATGCQTRNIGVIQRGMTEAEVRERFGDPSRVAAGWNLSESVWYYHAYMAYRYSKWVRVPSGRTNAGGELDLIRTSAGVRYPKFKIVFTNGIVASASELAPPDL